MHPLEKRTLTSFFNCTSENPMSETYLEVRNLIMKKYHANPQSEISLNDLSDINVGEDKAKKLIMLFLAHWGLINFHPFPPPDMVADTEKNAETAEDASVIDNLFQFRMHSLAKVGLQVSSASTPFPQFLSESAIPDVLLPPEGPSVEYQCNSCSADCSRRRYHCQKQADFDLCPECYNDGKFGSGMTSADFILMEPGTEMSGTSSGSWSDQETLLLLEALELYGENWDEIAEHVATKTKVQCFLHFVGMPIEDTFLEGEVTSDVIKPEVPYLAAGKKDPLPLKTSHNPPETTSEGPKQPNDDLQQSETASVSSPIKHAAADELPSSPPSDTVKPSHVAASDDAQETVDNFAIDALKSAFQTVGAPCMHGVSISFAEAGNPVMSLVSYLAALVDSDTFDVSLRSSLRAMHENSPGIQLASRHCFFLEDPPNDGIDAVSCKSVVEVEQQKEERDSVAAEGIGESTLITSSNAEAGTQEAMDPSVSSKDCEKKYPVRMESNELPSDKEAKSNLKTKKLGEESTAVHSKEMHDSNAALNPKQTNETCSGAAVGDVLIDATSILGGATVVKILFVSLVKAMASCDSDNSWDWRATEAVLYCIQAVGSSVLPTEDEIMPQVFALLPKLPHQPPLLQTTCLTIGAYSTWLSACSVALPFLPSVIDILTRGMTTSEDSAEAACMAFRHVCDACRVKLCGSIGGLFHIYHKAVNGEGGYKVCTEDSLQLVEALSVVITELSLDKAKRALEALCVPAVNTLQGIINQGTESIKQLNPTQFTIHVDRLANIFRYVNHPEAVGDAFERIWPLFKSIFEHCAWDMRIMEALCRACKYAVRTSGKFIVVTIGEMLSVVQGQYQLHHQPCFLYLSSEVIKLFGSDPSCANYLGCLIESLFHHTTHLLTKVEDFTARPDIADDCFLLASRCIRYCPHIFVSSPVFSRLVDCSIIGITVQHREACNSILTFLSDVFNLGRSVNGEFRCIAENVIVPRGSSITRILVSYAMYTLASAYGDKVCVWANEALSLLPSAAVTGSERAMFLNALSSMASSGDSSSLIGPVKEFSDVCRRNRAVQDSVQGALRPHELNLVSVS